VLVRECRGLCDDYSGAEWIAAVTMIIPAMLFHVPSGICYTVIYFIVRRHQKVRERGRETFIASKPDTLIP
jgi:uncharacterized membrane protein YjjB (DUF3815 family)